MVSSENLASMVEPWTFWPAFSDPYLSEAFARDTETFTMALQKSLSSNYSSSSTTTTNPAAAVTDVLSPVYNLAKPETTSSSVVQTPSASGSDPDTLAPKRRSAAVPGTARGKITKRKPRASKRNITTFITADPANFRQMVQQVTGVRFGNGQLPVAPVLKPEPQRPLNRLQGCLPTLDTSAFLLDHQPQQQTVGSTSDAAEASFSTVVQPPMTVSQLQPTMAADGGSGFDFDSFSCFPTLESWKVM